MSESDLLADAIRGLDPEGLVSAFERTDLSREARALVRAEVLCRLLLLATIGEMAPPPEPGKGPPRNYAGLKR